MAAKFAVLNHNTQRLVSDDFDGANKPYVFETGDKAQEWINDQSKHIETDGFQVVELTEGEGEGLSAPRGIE